MYVCNNILKILWLKNYENIFYFKSKTDFLRFFIYIYIYVV